MNDRMRLSDRFMTLKSHIDAGRYTVMIIGLGSVGTYLLDYLVSSGDEAMKIVVVGRDRGKMEKSVNIVRISCLIRERSRSEIVIEDGVDLNDISLIKKVIDRHQPDFIVNSSRAYPGLKYGTISWTSFRAYGIWSPLAIRFTKNIMQAWDEASSDAIVINTSYSDAVIPWLKSAGKAYPDFGSGNLNHLVPRIRYAAAGMLGVNDYWNVDVMFAAGHFHDVVISKEGHTEGVELPLKLWYGGRDITTELDRDEIFKRCAIAMPTDSQRNMMNASSDYSIISSIVSACRDGETKKLFIPGAFGEIGGYPVCIGCKKAGAAEVKTDDEKAFEGTDDMHLSGDRIDAWIDQSVFSFQEMNTANRKSMYLDGIGDVRDGCLFYTDELIDKVRDKFGVELPGTVAFDEIEDVAKLLIDDVIKKASNGG